MSATAQKKNAVTSRLLLASQETWSPTLASGEKPDLEKIRQEASDLMKQGRYEDALQRHLWYHNHALQIDPAQSAVRLSFALRQWAELSGSYPKARQSLMETRDRGVREFASGGGSFALFQEVEAINERLGQAQATFELFTSIQQRYPELAKQCYYVMENALIEKGDYAACANFIPDFQQRFEFRRDVYRRTGEISDRTPEVNSANIRKEAQRNFINDTRKLIEILVGVSRMVEAEKIREQSVAVLNVPELQSAVSDAEANIRAKHGQTGNPAAQQSVEPADLREARAKLAELKVSLPELHPDVKTAEAIVSEMERLAREEPTAPADLRAAKINLVRMRMEYGEAYPHTKTALSRVKEIERILKDEPNTPPDLREAKAHLIELREEVGPQHPTFKKALARIAELERMTNEEPTASAELREAKARLVEIRIEYGNQHPLVQQALARIQVLEGK